jgi:polysaccharide export outer membrane protein
MKKQLWIEIAVLSLVFTVGLPFCAAQSAEPATKVGAAADTTGSAKRVAYVLGPDDQISIHVVGDEDISDKPMRIGMDGFITLPEAGRIHAAGLTVEQLQSELTAKLRIYIKEPEVSVNVMEMHSQPVSVIGSVASPGIQQLQGRKTLIEMLAQAGGLKPDAGYRLKITRMLKWGPIPLPGAHDDPTGQYSVAEVGVRGIMEANDPAENILIMPNDIISVPRAEMVYVVGDVTKPGSIILGDQKTMSVLQALSIASGLSKYAKPTDARIMRVVPNSSTRVEIPVDLKKILNSKSKDITMQAEDILFIPNSLKKEVSLTALQAMVGGLGAIIYRVP